MASHVEFGQAVRPILGNADNPASGGAVDEPAAAAFVSTLPAAVQTADRDPAILHRHFQRMSTPTPRDRQNAEGTPLKERSREWRGLASREGHWPTELSLP
jgi:hypothetical protein